MRYSDHEKVDGRTSLWYRLHTSFLVCLFCLSVLPPAEGQTVRPTSDSSLALALAPVRERLAEDGGTIDIVHLGDSHIQSGYLTQVIRERLQAKYGDAGRGWLTPYKMARTNQPTDYSIYSSSKHWQNEKMSYRNAATLAGPGGVVLTHRSRASLDFTVSVRKGEFDRVLVSHTARSPRLSAGARETSARLGKGQGTTYVIDTLDLDKATAEVHLRTQGTTSATVEYGGFSLHRRGTKGIRYSDIALNGAMYPVYNRAHFVQNLSSLRPHLLLISLGTNEALNNCTPEAFRTDARALIAALRRALPETVIVLMTPPLAYDRKGRPMKSIETVRQVLHDVATDEGLGIIDLYELMGGFSGWDKSKVSTYLSRDKIHYNVEGYKYLGGLVADTLLKALE